MTRTAAKGALRCSFCGKSQHEIVRLVAGPGVYICNECVGLCNEIIAEEMAKKERAMPSHGGRPVATNLLR